MFWGIQTVGNTTASRSKYLKMQKKAFTIHLGPFFGEFGVNGAGKA
jgi:hypothetical protein